MHLVVCVLKTIPKDFLRGLEELEIRITLEAVKTTAWARSMKIRRRVPNM